MKKCVCPECGATFLRQWVCSKSPAICSETCKARRRERRRKKVEMPCTECGVIVILSGERGLAQARQGRAYCSEQCKRAYCRRVSARNMAETNRKYAAERMRKRNPMHRKESREAMSRTLRSIGHCPKVRGGNGRGPTVPERRMSQALGWPTNVIVRTRQPRGSGYPTNYKIDVGNPELKVAVEIDGSSHCALKRRAQDSKKDAFLRSIGWTVFRFSNRDVMERLEECVQTVMSTISK